MPISSFSYRTGNVRKGVKQLCADPVHRLLSALVCFGPLGLGPTQALAQERPDAGRIQQQLRVPPAPVPAAKPPEIRIEAPPASGKGIDTPAFHVAGFRIVGATAFPQKVLLEQLGPAGLALTLGQIQARADQLAKFYADRGYSVARALVPAQDVRDSIVEIRLLEGRYGRIDIRNATEVSESRIRSLLGEAKEGELVYGPALERGVLLIAELAGIVPKATLEPGESSGLTDLVLEIGAGRTAEYDLSFDNAGSRFTGSQRISAGLIVNSPADIGDRLTARVVTSGRELLSLRLAYEAPVGASGLRGGPYLSRTTYQLGDAFAALDASGTADALGASFTHPLIRSSAFNLRASVGGEARIVEDKVGATDTLNNKRARVLQLGLGGDARDALLAGGMTGFQLLLTRGSIALQTAALAAADAAGAGTQGGYGKLLATVNHTQALTEAWRLSVNFTGQWAWNNLDSSEKFSVGGLSGVRAYPPGEASGDQAQLVQVELRHQGFLLGPGQFAPFGFYDAAKSRINHRIHAAFAGANTRDLAGYGLGAEWTVPGGGFIRAWFARKSGSEVASADVDRASRFWTQAGLAF